MKTCNHVRQYWCGERLPCAVPTCRNGVRGEPLYMRVETDRWWEPVKHFDHWTFTRSTWDGFWSWAIRDRQRGIA